MLFTADQRDELIRTAAFIVKARECRDHGDVEDRLGELEDFLRIVGNTIVKLVDDIARTVGSDVIAESKDAETFHVGIQQALEDLTCDARLVLNDHYDQRPNRPHPNTMSPAEFGVSVGRRAA